MILIGSDVTKEPKIIKKIDWRNRKWLDRVTFHLYNSVLMQNLQKFDEVMTFQKFNISWKFPKNAIKSIICNEVKVWWWYNTSNINACQLCIKKPKKHSKIKERSITYRYIWHTDISKFVYWLYTHSVEVWWSYVLSNTNTVHFCERKE